LQLGSERVVIKSCDKRMHDYTADGGSEDGRRDTLFVSDGVAHEDTAQPIHHVSERLVLSKELDDFGIAEEGIHRAPVFYCKIDDTYYQYLASLRPGWLGFGSVNHCLQAGKLGSGRGDDDFVLSSELVIDRRLCHPDGVCNHL